NNQTGSCSGWHKAACLPTHQERKIPRAGAQNDARLGPGLEQKCQGLAFRQLGKLIHKHENVAHVCNVSNLLYRGFPIRKPCGSSRAVTFSTSCTKDTATDRTAAVRRKMESGLCSDLQPAPVRS